MTVLYAVLKQLICCENNQLIFDRYVTDCQIKDSVLILGRSIHLTTVCSRLHRPTKRSSAAISLWLLARKRHSLTTHCECQGVR